MSDMKSCNLGKLCLNMLVSWESIDVKVHGNLIGISTGQKIPEETAIINQEQRAVLANKTCTIYTILKETTAVFNTVTLARFFDNYNERLLTLEEKENIYWKIRLRYSCSIIPVAPVIMYPQLQKKGYTHWMLPNGTTIPINALLLIAFSAIPNNFNIVKSVFTTNSEIVNTLIETVEVAGTVTENELPIQHTILGALLPSGEKYVIDPVSLQFGMRGKYNKLMFCGSWEEYCQKFPGHDITMPFDNWVPNRSLAETLYEIGNQCLGHVDKIISDLLPKLDENSCNYCGSFVGGARETILMVCSKCKTTYYCNQSCQKSDWKFHKTECKRPEV